MRLARPLFLLTAATLAATASGPTRADEALEHPIIKPMRGAVLREDVSRRDAFGQMQVRVRRDGKTIGETVSGRFWHLEYQHDADTSRAEILANYAAEAARVGGEVLDQSATRLRFRVNHAAGTSWAVLDARAGGAYELEIVDEAPLERQVEFDADAMSTALTRDGRVSVYGILFATDRADLEAGSGVVLDTVAAVLKRDPALKLEVQGHTDATGSADHNRALSLARAEAVTAALGLFGISRHRLLARGYGADRPVADNTTEAGRRQNRRVDLVRMR